MGQFRAFRFLTEASRQDLQEKALVVGILYLERKVDAYGDLVRKDLSDRNPVPEAMLIIVLTNKKLGKEFHILKQMRS